MAIFKAKLFELRESIEDNDQHNQIRSVLRILNHIEKSKCRKEVIQEYLSINLPNAINDIICTQLTLLQPSLKLIRHLMTDFHFRNYLFLPILKNILRSLIFFVQTDGIQQAQLEFFDVIDILDVLLKKFLSNNIPHIQRVGNKDIQATFVCLLMFVELVLMDKCASAQVKHLMVEVYFRLLAFNEAYKCSFKSFTLIMKLANIGEAFLDRFIEEYKRDESELWLYKILEILLRIFESTVGSTCKPDLLAAKVFENIFSTCMVGVSEGIMSPKQGMDNLNLFRLFIAVLNTIIWTPVFNQKFRCKVLKKFVSVEGDRRVLSLSKSSRNIRKHTTYTMKIFLTGLVYFAENSRIEKHRILQTLLQSRLYDSIIDLKPTKVQKSYKGLILLYGTTFLKQSFSNPLNAHRILENVLIILNTFCDDLDEDEIWIVFKIFAYCSNYASLSELEYAGVHRTAEILLKQVSKASIHGQAVQFHIDKYIVSFVSEFSMTKTIVNSMIFMYLTQPSSVTSSKLSRLIATHTVLPLLISSDSNQVENAVKVLQRKQLTRVDLNIIVEQCFTSTRAEELAIGAGLKLINLNLCMVSDESLYKIYCETIEFLVAKQKTPKLSKECYLGMVTTCGNLMRFKAKVVQT